MTSEQQRSIDLGIINGDLVDAIRLYRAYTGADLSVAKTYVDQRSATLDEPSGTRFRAESPSAPSFGPPLVTSTSVTSATQFALPRPFMRIIWTVVIVSVISAIGAGVLPIVLMTQITGGLLGSNGILSQFTIVNEPYYRELVARIQDDANFRAALGVPIAIDDAHVRCSQISDNSVMQQSSCTLPASGPKGSGSVQTHVVNRPGALDAAFRLLVGDRIIQSRN